MTKYARDEFDQVPETSARQGVHRAVSTSRRRSLVPILAVGFAALAIGLVAFLILPKFGFASAGEAAVLPAETESVSASPTPAASTQVPPSASPSAVPGGTPSPSATVQDTPEAAVPAVDKTQPVTIYNATTMSGLASRVGGTVSSAGWTLGSLGNWSGVRQQGSVVFYSGAAQKDNAESLALLLEIPTVVQSAEFQAPLVVVLGPGFQ